MCGTPVQLLWTTESMLTVISTTANDEIEDLCNSIGFNQIISPLWSMLCRDMERQVQQ